MPQVSSRASFRKCLSGCWDKYLGKIAVGEACATDAARSQRCHYMCRQAEYQTQQCCRRPAQTQIKRRSNELRHHNGSSGQRPRPIKCHSVSQSPTVVAAVQQRGDCQGHSPQQQITKSCAEVSRGTHRCKTCCAPHHRREIDVSKQYACGWPPTPAREQQRRTATGGQLGAQFRSLEVSRTRSPWIP